MSGLMNLSSPQLGSGHLDEGSPPPPPPDSGQEDPVPIGEGVFFQSRFATDLESGSYSHRFSPTHLNSSFRTVEVVEGFKLQLFLISDLLPLMT